MFRNEKVVEKDKVDRNDGNGWKVAINYKVVEKDKMVEKDKLVRKDKVVLKHFFQHWYKK